MRARGGIEEWEARGGVAQLDCQDKYWELGAGCGERTPEESQSWAAPRTAPGSACALLFFLQQPRISSLHAHTHTLRFSPHFRPDILTHTYCRQTRSAIQWQNPTCNHPWSQPHSFSRSGFISTLTVITFSLLKNLVHALSLPFPFLEAPDLIIPHFFSLLLPPPP